MNDSDWRDPFADDEAARERERRRAERAARRRAREQEARDSLGERVREELSGPGEGAGPPAGPPPIQSLERPEDATAQQPPASPRAAVKHAGPTPPRRPPSSAQVRHRRTILLLALGALIVLVAGVGVVLSRSGDDGTAPAAPKDRKTLDVTIPEGYDRSQVAAVAKKAGIKGNYEQASKSSRAIDLKEYGAQSADSLEGFLFPATYEMFRNDDAKALVAKQVEAFQSNVEGVDMSAADDAGLSVYDVVIVASMIEREIAVPEERELAASVIYNRLEANNPLGIDATIRFEDRNYDEPLVQSRLDTDTPYNTHTKPGLPPGPIGNPGLASLEAAANPADTDFFYYVVKPGTCNEHEFVETQAEFDAAVAEYNAARDAAGGRSPTDC